MCPKTCSGPCEDNDEALGEYTTMTGLFSNINTVCTADTVVCGDSPVVDAICRSKCGKMPEGRVLKMGAPQELVRPLRRALADARLDALARRLRTTSTHRAHRRLGSFEMDGTAYREVYYTFAKITDLPCPGSTPSPDMLDGADLYDVIEWAQPLTELELGLSCPSQKRYETPPGLSSQFCRHHNIPVPYNENPKIVSNACFRKCHLAPTLEVAMGSRHPFRAYENITGDPPRTWNTIIGGGNDWCAGNEIGYTMETNALCLPREECEALCTE